MANAAMDTADDVIRVLRRVMRQSTGGNQLQATAGKLDQAARWASWATQLKLKLKNITGPGSAHYFKFI